MKLFGKPVSEGIVSGKVLLYTPFQSTREMRHIEIAAIEEELKTFEKAKAAANRELTILVERLQTNDPDQAAILLAHQDILADPIMDEEIRAAITTQCLSADSSVERVYSTYAQLLRESGNTAMKERASDLCDVKSRLIRCCLGGEEKNLTMLSEPVIIVAEELFPSDAAALDREKVLGIIAEVGGSTSHTAIIARSFGIPAILGVQDALTQLKDSETVLLDALEGTVTVQPTPEELFKSELLRQKLEQKQRNIRQFLDTEPVTKDGERIQVRLNITSADPQELLGTAHCDGSGLFRTEFLFLTDDHLPTEEEQFNVYKKVAERFGEKLGKSRWCCAHWILAGISS